LLVPVAQQRASIKVREPLVDAALSQTRTSDYENGRAIRDDR